nr:MATH domain and coiled-coil domain-containing protein At3g58250-like [Ipomoea batatas]
MLYGVRNFLVYPNGDVKTNSIGHISMSVCIEDAAALPKDWAKYADLKFFIYDQVRQKYSVFQVGGASSLHDFHSLKTEGGITKLVSRAVFDDAANGYLVNDKCVFGVEVFLLDSKFAEERLNMCVEVDKTFTWTISNYSKLGSEVHNSYEFPAASFKWQICLYPLGNVNSSGEHLSLVLKLLVDKKITCPKLLVHFTLCVRNQKSGKHREYPGIEFLCGGRVFSMYPNGVGGSKGHISVFLCIQDTAALPLGGINIFHGFKLGCGISKLVPRSVFDDAANGYLVGDKCVFGVEVFVLHSKFVEQHLCPSVKVGKSYTWKVSSFSNMRSKTCYSDEFTAASFQWKLVLHPLGQSKKSNGLNLSLFLTLVDPGVTFNGLYLHFMLRIINQKYGKHQEKQACTCFVPGNLSWGWEEFIPLVDLQDLSNRFIVDDCIIIEACIKNVSVIS